MILLAKSYSKGQMLIQVRFGLVTGRRLYCVERYGISH